MNNPKDANGNLLSEILVIDKSDPINVTIGSSVTTVLAANNNRMYVLLTNDSDETIYLALSENAELNKGIRLNANGGSYEIVFENLYRGVISAICVSGNKNLCISENVMIN